MAAIGLYNRDTTFLQVYVTGLDINYSRNDRYIRWWFNYSAYGDQYLNAGISNSPAYNISGLSPNTQYPVGAVIYYTAYAGGPYSSVALTDQYFTTLANARPSYFYWYNYGTGYSPQNRSMNGNKPYLYRPYATAWNAMRTNVINLLIYKGVISSSGNFPYYGNYFPEVTNVAPNNKITAAHYNKVAACINAALGGTYVYPVSQGVTAYTENYFYYLQYYLNLIA